MMTISAFVPVEDLRQEQSDGLPVTANTERTGDNFSALLFLMLGPKTEQGVPPPAELQAADATIPLQGNSDQQGNSLTSNVDDSVSDVTKGIAVAVSLLTNQHQVLLTGIEEAPAGTPPLVKEKFAASGNDPVAISNGLASTSVLPADQNASVFSQPIDPKTSHTIDTTLSFSSAQNLSSYSEPGLSFTHSPKISSEASGVSDQETIPVSVDPAVDKTPVHIADPDSGAKQTLLTQASLGKPNSPSSLAAFSNENPQFKTELDATISTGDEISGNLATAVTTAKGRLGQDQNAKLPFDEHGNKSFQESFSRSHEYSPQPSDPSANVSSFRVSNPGSLASGEEKPTVSRPLIVDQVADGVVTNLRQQKHEAVIALDPPELGSLKINLTLEDGKVQMRILAETHESRRLIENHLPELKQALQIHRLDLIEAKVDGGSWNRSTGDMTQSFQRGSEGRQQRDWQSGDPLQSMDERPDVQKADPIPLATGRVSMWA